MDPRHPEKVISYIEEVKAKYDSVNERIDKATSSKEINALEREGVACVNELFIVVPRLQEALITHSAEARRNLRRKVSMEPIVEPVEPEEQAEPAEPAEEVADVVVPEMEKTTEETEAETEAEEPEKEEPAEAEEAKESEEKPVEEVEPVEPVEPKPVEEPKKKTARKKSTKKADK